MKYFKYSTIFFSYFLLFFLLTSALFSVAQDTINQNVKRNHRFPNKAHNSLVLPHENDSALVNTSDTIRQQIRNIQLGYLNNIHASALENVVSNIVLRTNAYEKLKMESGLDTLNDVKTKLKSDENLIKSIRISLSNYINSVQSSKNQIDAIRKNLEKQTPNFRSTHQHVVLEEMENMVILKLDSLVDINRKVSYIIGFMTNQTLRIDRLITDKIKEEVTAEKNTGSPNLWNANSSSLSQQGIVNNIKNNVNKNSAIEKYISHNDWGSRILLALISLGYFYWIFRVNYVISRSHQEHKPIPLWRLICKTLLFFFTLLPIVNIFTPTIIIQSAQFILILLCINLLFSRMSKIQKRIIWILFLFYMFDIISNVIVNDGLFFRILCILINIIAITIVVYIKRKIKSAIQPGYISHFIFVTFILLNGSAILLNIFGFIEASRGFSIAAAVGLVQSFTLKYFVQMILADVRLQFKKDRLTNGFWVRFNEDRFVRVVRDICMFLCVLIIVIVLANNLQFVEKLYDFIADFLSKSRKIGNINFNFENLLVAILLVILTNWLQKNISLIVLGGTDGKIRQSYDQKMTLFPLFRLGIILIGFFIAISALGMSMDKLTVVIGALSVGIGLGMQNIISNFVSGIILVFDKPFRVGDQIELSDKKGRVKEIGIRSSILQTVDGAEVIIPNGDLLSGRIVNWTLSSEYGRATFTVHVDRQVDLQTVLKWIEEAMKESSYYIENLGNTIMVEDISDQYIYLNIAAWINNAGNSSNFKNDVLLRLYKKFEENNLKFNSVIPTVVRS